MTSILTNTAATAALQTLRTLSDNLGSTQREVSTGLRVSRASDNAAYWSVATTMRSDNMSLSAVQDALGLGGATVDTAYAGMSAVADVLNEFKAKLVAAAEEGVDRSKIQEELEQLKQQVVSISESASFSGQNWLNVDVDLSTAKRSVVSSFVRDGSGGVSVKTANIELSDVALFNKSRGAILQQRYEITMPDPNAPGGVGLKDVGGIDVDPFIGAIAYSEIRYPGVLTSWPVTFAAADEITFDATLNSSVYGPGQSAQVTINQSVVNAALGRVDGTIPNQSALKTVIDYAFNLSSLSVLSNAAYIFGAVQVSIIPDQGSEVGHSIQISNVTSNLAGGYAFGIDKPPIKLVNNPYPKASFNFTSPFSVLDDANFSFTLAMSVPGGGPMSVTTHTVNKAAVDAALGTADGRIGSAADYATVLAYVTSGSDVLFSATGGRVDVDINTAVRPYQGTNSTFFIDNVAKHERTTGGSPSDPDDLTTFDFLGIDITTGNVALSSYISAVDNMLHKTVSGAAALGAVQSRIDMQSEFASKLYDSITSGIGRLVDADMNEASTRLKAQQTQEQLAIQSLSISNSSADTVLSLFRQ